MTAEERAIYVTRLQQAQSAYHTLMLGKQAKVFVDSNGERIEYNAATRGQLLAYINELKTLLGLMQPQGPLEFLF